jgi:hypothetical protein
MKSLRTKTIKRKTTKRHTSARPLARIARAPKDIRPADAKLKKAANKLAPPAADSALQDAVIPPRADVTAFELGDVNQAAPLLTLVVALFEAPNMPTRFADPGADFLANALMSVSDEVELTEAANNGLDLGEVKGRASMRTEWRARIAVEIARRMQTGEVSS